MNGLGWKCTCVSVIHGPLEPCPTRQVGSAALQGKVAVLDKVQLPAPVVCSICRQAADHPEFRGTVWRRKDGKGTPMSWSATLIQDAGGLYRLFTEWEPEK